MTNAPWYAPYVAKASGWLSDAANLADMAQGSTVNLAVTGLSRSGKTVFITSLIHNLLSAVHNPNRMPLLGVVGGGRLIGARLESPGAGRLPRFRYQENIEAMAAGAPAWPAGTDDLREIGIDMRFMPANAPGKLLSEISGSPATITIRIVDYPGEWLLDLPLLAQSYAEWSRATLRLYRRGVRAEAASDFLAFIAQHRHDEAASEETAKQAHDLYRAFLFKARDTHGLSHLQPGRFLCPGNLADAPFLWFAPLDVADNAVFDAEHARRADGRSVTTSTSARSSRASTRITSAGSRGRSCWSTCCARCSPAARRSRTSGSRSKRSCKASATAPAASFSKLIWGPHIDKVLFAATKADHVPDIQRDHLAELLRNMAAFPAIEAKSASARFDVIRGRLGHLDRRGHAGDRRPARAGRGRPADRRRASRRNSSSARCRSGRRGRTPGTRRSSTCRCSSRR